MQSKKLKSKLKELEGRAYGQRTMLTMENGTEIGIRIKDPLALLLQSFRRAHAQMSGQPQPESPLDPQLNLLRSCKSVDPSADNLTHLVKETLK